MGWPWCARGVMSEGSGLAARVGIALGQGSGRGWGWVEDDATGDGLRGRLGIRTLGRVVGALLGGGSGSFSKGRRISKFSEV
jgi:hypothetical protein